MRVRLCVAAFSVARLPLMGFQVGLKQQLTNLQKSIHGFLPGSVAPYFACIQRNSLKESFCLVSSLARDSCRFRT